MKRVLVAFAIILLSAPGFAGWHNVGPGVDFQEFRDGSSDIYVARIDLSNDAIRIVASRESEKGTRVSDFARKVHALAAINGDYFDASFNPIGLTVGPCGEWSSALRSKREGYVAVGDDQAEILAQSKVSTSDTAEGWMEAAISGWPALVVGCRVVRHLPGSDAFTRSPHPRTAVGLSKDGSTLYFVVADGRRSGVPGLTLPQLASFMSEQLGACSALNFDGGGSTAMWLGDRIVNRPSDGVERPVGDALAVVLERDFVACDAEDEAAKIAAIKAKEAEASETVTTTKTVVTTTKTQSPPKNPQPPRP